MSVQEVNLTGTITIAKEEPSLEEITITPASEDKEYLPSGDGFSKVIVESMYPVRINESNVVTSINIPNADIDLPSNATSIRNSAFLKSPVLHTISGDGITEIGVGAFTDCKRLVSISFPNCITVNQTAFKYCEKLETVELDNVELIDAEAFGGCVKLESIRLPKCSTLNKPFMDCSLLADIYLGYDGVVTKTGTHEDWNLAGTFNIHVPSNQLTNYQNSQSWQSLKQELYDEDGIVLNFVGDYE